MSDDVLFSDLKDSVVGMFDEAGLSVVESIGLLEQIKLDILLSESDDVDDEVLSDV